MCKWKNMNFCDIFHPRHLICLPASLELQSKEETLTVEFTVMNLIHLSYTQRCTYKIDTDNKRCET